MIYLKEYDTKLTKEHIKKFKQLLFSTRKVVKREHINGYTVVTYKNGQRFKFKLSQEIKDILHWSK